MSRRGNSVSIRQLNTTTTTNEETGETTTTISGPSIVNNADDVETVISTMINNNDILDEEDVNELIDAKLTDYTKTTDLQNDYTTKTLLTNTLDNYVSKELLTQSLSEKANYTTTDALELTTTNHENRIKGLEDNFVSTTTFTEVLANKANSSHTHSINDLNYDSSNTLKSVIDNKANSTHTHTLNDITDYVAYDDSNCAKLNNDNVFSGTITASNVLSNNETRLAAVETLAASKANSSHTHNASDIGYPYSYTVIASAGDSSYEPEPVTHTGTTLLSELLQYDYIPSEKLTITKPLQCSSYITASNVLYNNETRLAAAETSLSNKASKNHTHSLSEITNLETTLSNKAASSHTHTLSDITDYAETDLTSMEEDINELTNQVLEVETELSNCAKLDANNTFTANNTFRGLNHFQSLAAADGTFNYRLILNGQDVLTDDSNYAKLDTANTFTGNNEHTGQETFKAKTTIDTQALQGLEIITKDSSNISTSPLRIKSNDSQSILIGSDFSQSAYAFEIYYANSNNYMYNWCSMGMKNYGGLQFYYNRMEMSKPLKNSEQITASKLDTTNTTASNAIGGGLAKAIIDLVYPVGSLYTSFNSTSPATLFNFGTWEQIVDRFLYCANSSGTTGGEATHNHSTGNHTLTIAEIPSHNHVVGTYNSWEPTESSYTDTMGGVNGWNKFRYWPGYCNNTGGGKAHNHGNTGNASSMPPYITVYCWKRTA